MTRIFTYTANLDKIQSARKSEEHRSKPKRIRQRFLEGHLLDVASKEEKHPNLANIKQAGNPPLSQRQKIARAKRKKEGRGAVAHAQSTPIVLPLVVVLLLFVPGVGAVSATSVLQLLTMFTATSVTARNRALSSDSTPEYSVDSLVANCATGAKWTLTQPNSGIEYALAGVAMLSGYKLKCPRIYVSEISRSTNSSRLLGINAQNGIPAFSYTREPRYEYHDGRFATTSIVTANPSSPSSGNTITIGTAQQNSGFLDSQVCENITQTPPAKSADYASTYDMNLFDKIYPTYFHRKLTYAADFTTLAPHSIPQKGEIDVTPHKTSLSVYFTRMGEGQWVLAVNGMIKITSTATQQDLCIIYTMGDGAAPIHTQLAVYQDDSSVPKQIRMPQEARALFVDVGEVNDYLSIKHLNGNQDLAIAGRDLNGRERLLVIEDFDKIESVVNCTDLLEQPTGWQEIRIQGQRKGVFNFFDRRTALLAATPTQAIPAASNRPNLFLSTIDNPTAPLWKINLNLFSGQIILGENHTITMPIQVPTFYNTTEAITVHQTISLSQLPGSEEQILVVGQTYVYDGGTPVDVAVLDTLTAFNATTGKRLFVITGGIDTWGMGMNHQTIASDALLVAQMNGQAGMITLNLASLQTGATQAYFIPGTQEDYTLYCMGPPSPSSSPTPTPTPTPIPAPPRDIYLVAILVGAPLSLILVVAAGLILRDCFCRRRPERAAALPQEDRRRRGSEAQYQASSSARFFAMPSVVENEIDMRLNQEHYIRLCHELEELRQGLYSYAEQPEAARLLEKIDNLLFEEVADQYRCSISGKIMDEPAYINIRGQRNLLAEKKALVNYLRLNKEDLSGNDVSHLRHDPIEINAPVQELIQGWLQKLENNIATLHQESSSVVDFLSETHTSSSRRGGYS